EDGIRDGHVTGVQTCALPISSTATIPNGRRKRRKSSKGPAPKMCRPPENPAPTSPSPIARCYGEKSPSAKTRRTEESARGRARKIGRASCRERGEKEEGAGAV